VAVRFAPSSLRPAIFVVGGSVGLGAEGASTGSSLVHSSRLV
jgi:hypothetical protein